MQKRLFIVSLILSASSVSAIAEVSPLVFAGNEGVTYGVNPGVTFDRFKDMTDDLTRILKRPVKMQPVSAYKELAAGLAEQRYDIAYVHPAHDSIPAMSKGNYRLAALTKGFTE